MSIVTTWCYMAIPDCDRSVITVNQKINHKEKKDEEKITPLSKHLLLSMPDEDVRFLLGSKIGQDVIVFTKKLC